MTVAVALLSGIGTAACQRSDSEEAGMATPSVTLDRASIAVGSGLKITYKFVVAADAAFTRDYRVFAHVTDADGERMWDDDHNPPTPTSHWKPGATVEYTRTIFVPVFPYLGEATLEVGLYAATGDGERVPLTGEGVGQRAYRVARFELLPETNKLYTVRKEGWYIGEASKPGGRVEWQWTKQQAAMAVQNLKRDMTLYLELDHAGSPDSRVVQVMLGGQAVDTFSLAQGDRMLRTITLPAALLGTDDMSDVRIVVDKTFVPAQVDPANTRDVRVLGVRVFHAYVSGG